MKEKRVCVMFLVLAVMFLLVLVSAADDAEVEKSYACLKTQLGDNCGNSINTEQTSFNLLAMAYDSKVQGDCKSSLKNKKNNDCWGQAQNNACDIKPTALAVFALNSIDENVDDSVKWLLSKKQSKTSLIWFLEIDSSNITLCTINGAKITVNENKKISGADPTGLKKAYNNYWFEITNTDRNYTVSCDKDFVTTLLYQKPGNPVFYVSSQTHTASAADSTTEKVESYCFSTSSQCDYEGSLWAALALVKTDEDVSPYIPYLTAMSDETANKKYLSQAFLYMLTNADDYYSSVLSLQKESKYWLVDKNKLYDTSIALFALQGANTNEVDNAKKYLLTIRETTGCWNDNYMSFVLYSAWPKIPTTTTTGTTIPQCENFGGYCTAQAQCNLEDQLENYNCYLSGDICCKTQPQEQNCSEKNGFVCSSEEKCSGSEVQASDTYYCCQGACQSTQTTENDCEISGYNCRDSCLTSEQESLINSKYCSLGQLCCAPKPASSNKWLLIILLIILIILVIIAFFFRNQLKIWMFRAKSGFGSKKIPPSGSRPMIQPFRSPMSRPSPQYLYQRAAASPRRPAGRTEKDKDFDETMRKLRDMSK
ncbi:MAG: hypothetical protein AABX54_02190 [Nanoarchaeota archaeon]